MSTNDFITELFCRLADRMCGVQKHSQMALFNVLVQWDGYQPHDGGMIHLSIAKFSL